MRAIRLGAASLIVVLSTGVFVLPAAADDESGITVKSSVSPMDPAELVTEPSAPRNIWVIGNTEKGQDVHVFTLSPTAQIAAGSRAVSVDPGNLAPELHRNSVIWVANNYLDFGETPPNWETPQYRASAQLAIWALTGNYELAGSTDILDRARALYREGLENLNAEPPEFHRTELGRLTATPIEQYPDGEEIQFRLDSEKSALPGERIDLYDNENHPYRTMDTQNFGTQSLDIPWSVSGPLTARWTSTVRPGTVLQADATLLVTTQAIPVTDSEEIPHAAPELYSRGLTALSLASRQLVGIAGLITVVIVVGVVALGGTIFKHANERWQRVLPAVLIALVAAGVGVVVLANHAQKVEFHPLLLPEDPDPRVSEEQQSAIKFAGSTSSFKSSTGPACAVDGKTETSWVTGRGLGANQELLLETESPVWVNQLVLVPGDGRSPRTYTDRGVPTRVQFLTSSGQFDEFRLSRGDRGDRYTLSLRHIYHADTFMIRINGREADKFSYGISEASLVLNLESSRTIRTDPLSSPANAC